jgi:hypothetical protein
MSFRMLNSTELLDDETGVSIGTGGYIEDIFEQGFIFRDPRSQAGAEDRLRGRNPFTTRAEDILGDLPPGETREIRRPLLGYKFYAGDIQVRFREYTEGDAAKLEFVKTCLRDAAVVFLREECGVANPIVEFV